MNVKRLISVVFVSDTLQLINVDGVPYVTMKPVVTALRMSWGSQHTKLLENKEKFSYTVIGMTGTDGKTYEMGCIPLKKLNGWLFGINPKNIPNLETRAKIENYQEDCFEVLWQHWSTQSQSTSQQPYMPRGYPQMLEAARNDWKTVRNDLITLLGTHLNVFDRKRKSQFTNQVYIDLIEATAQQLRAHFQLTRPSELTRDYLHQLVQECIVEIEIRLSDALTSGAIYSWEEFKMELERIADHIRYMKELQNGRIPLPDYAYPVVRIPATV